MVLPALPTTCSVLGMNPHPRVWTALLEADAAFAQLLSAVLGSPTDSVDAVEARAQRMLPEQRAIVWEGDPTTFQFTYVSPAAEAVLGYPVRRWLEKPTFWTDIIVHPHDRTAAVTYCALATGRGLDHDFSYRAQTADGRTVRLHDIVHVIKGSRQVAVRLRGVMVEVPDTEPELA